MFYTGIKQRLKQDMIKNLLEPIFLQNQKKEKEMVG